MLQHNFNFGNSRRVLYVRNRRSSIDPWFFSHNYTCPPEWNYCMFRTQCQSTVFSCVHMNSVIRSHLNKVPSSTVSTPKRRTPNQQFKIRNSYTKTRTKANERSRRPKNAARSVRPQHISTTPRAENRGRLGERLTRVSDCTSYGLDSLAARLVALVHSPVADPIYNQGNADFTVPFLDSRFPMHTSR